MLVNVELRTSRMDRVKGSTYKQKQTAEEGRARSWGSLQGSNARTT